MSDEYGNDFITITDDDGNEFELEHLDTLESNGSLYMAFAPADIDEDDEDFGMIILKAVIEDGEDILTSIDDEKELDAVFDLFVERFSDENEE